MAVKFSSNQNLDARDVLGEVVPREKPYRIFLEPSGFCNLKCVFCPMNTTERGRQQKRDFMKWSLLEKFVAQVKEFTYPQLKILDLCGFGEPTMHKDIAKIVAYLKDAGIAETINLITNGTLLTPKLGKELVDAGLDRMKISVEALREEDFWEIAGYRLDLKQYVENIRRFSSIKENCELYIKVTGLAIKTEEDKDFFIKTYGELADQIYIENATPIWADWDDEVLHQSDGRNSYYKELPKKEICTSPFKFLQVFADGTVSPCCGDWERKLALGNINETSLKDIWYGEKLAGLMKAFLVHKKNTIVPCNQCSLSLYTDADNIDGYEEEILIRLKNRIKF